MIPKWFKRWIGMEEALFVVEYKTTDELFPVNFVWTGYQYAHDHHFYYNDMTGEELFIYHKELTSMKTRPIRHNEN